jgi:hypothetical protein
MTSGYHHLRRRAIRRLQEKMPFGALAFWSATPVRAGPLRTAHNEAPCGAGFQPAFLCWCGLPACLPRQPQAGSLHHRPDRPYPPFSIFHLPFSICHFPFRQSIPDRRGARLCSTCNPLLAPHPFPSTPFTDAQQIQPPCPPNAIPLVGTGLDRKATVHKQTPTHWHSGLTRTVCL